jgi:type VI secretion system protein ImpK
VPPRPVASAPSAPPPQATSAGAAAPRLAGEAEALPKVGPGPLAAAASPLLQILARLANAGVAGQPPVEELRERALRALRAFEADARDSGATAEEIRAAHYVVSAALDDVVLGTPWGAQSAWAQKSLVSTFHQEVRSGERVFDLLAGMQKDPGRYKGALEVTYLALSLGLQGKYRLMPRGAAELDRVREGLYQLLQQLRGNYERELSPHWRGVDAPHRGQSRSVPAWVAFALALGPARRWLVLPLGQARRPGRRPLRAHGGAAAGRAAQHRPHRAAGAAGAGASPAAHRRPRGPMRCPACGSSWHRRSRRAS